MNTLSHTKAIAVRPGYREQDTWRCALGIFEPLYAFSILSGDLDAPEVLPAGSMRYNNTIGAMQNVAFRQA